MKALEKDRTRRYETANGLAADILRHLASEPVLAAPPSRMYRLRKFVRQEPRRRDGRELGAARPAGRLHRHDLGADPGGEGQRRAEGQERRAGRRARQGREAVRAGPEGDRHISHRRQRGRAAEERAVQGTADQAAEGGRRILRGPADAAGRADGRQVPEVAGGGLPPARRPDRQDWRVDEGLGGPEEGARGPAGAGGGVAIGTRSAARRRPDPGGRLSIALYDRRHSRGTPGERGTARMATALEIESPTDDVLEVLADSYSALGTTLDNIGKILPSQDAWRKGAEIRRRLADAHPTDTKYQFDLAKCYSSDVSVQVMMPWREMEEALSFQEKGVKILEQLVRDHPVSTEYQYWLAMSARDVGWAQGVMLWKPKEAEAAFISSFPLWRKLTETYPAVNAYQSELASAYAWFGLFQVYAGRGPQALDNLGKSRAIFQRLIESEADFPWNRISLALISQNAGEVLEDMGEESEAMEALRRSVVMGEKAVEGDPARPHWRMYLAKHHEAVGTLLERVGKPAEALKTYSEAYALRRRNAEALPKDAWAQRDLAGNRSLVSRLFHDTGKLAESLDAVEIALPIRRKLVAADPTNPKYQSFLASDLILAASILLRLDRLPEARARLEEAIPIQSGAVKRTPGYLQHAAVLADGYLQSGQVRRAGGDKAGAVADWKQAIEVLKTIPFLRGPDAFALACCHAALSEAASQTERSHRGSRAGDGSTEEVHWHEFPQPRYLPQRNGPRPDPHPRRLQEADERPGGTGDEAVGFASVTAVDPLPPPHRLDHQKQRTSRPRSATRARATMK